MVSTQLYSLSDLSGGQVNFLFSFLTLIVGCCCRAGGCGHTCMSVQPPSPRCTCVYLCVPVCTRVYPCVPVCTRVYPCVPVCARVCPCVPVCTRVYPCVPVCTVPVCTRVYLYLPCGWVLSVWSLTRVCPSTSAPLSSRTFTMPVRPHLLATCSGMMAF